MEHFNFNTLQNLTFAQQKEYITKCFIPLYKNSSHCILSKDINGNDTYEIITNQELKTTYFKRFEKKLSTFYFEEYTELKHRVYEINKPQFYTDENKISYVNLCPPLPKYKPFKDFDKSIQLKAKIFLDYMFEILCNKDKEMQKYLNQWIGNVCHGNKNDTAIVLRTYSQGVGKSTLPTMLSKHILGNRLCLETGSGPLLNNFNTILGGKLFVYFEELETFSKSQWMAVESVLKRQITSDVITLEQKGIDSFVTKNINNYMLLSNFDVKDNGRRFCVLDVQTHRKGDIQNIGQIYIIIVLMMKLVMHYIHIFGKLI